MSSHTPIAAETAVEEDPPLCELPIVPDVGLNIHAPSWQDGIRSPIADEPSQQIRDLELKAKPGIPCEVKGPPHVIKFLEAETGVSEFIGYLSPPNKITIRGKRAKVAGIPSNASYYAFSYPLECLSGQYQRLVSADKPPEPWLCFLLIGGYLYYDVDRKLIQANAFVLQPTERKLTLAGPFRPSPMAVEALRSADRLRELTLAPLREQGFERWGWVNPAERPGGHALLADGGELPNNGAFLFESAGGEFALYSLINKALFGVADETAATTTTLLSLPARPSHAFAAAGAEAPNLLLDRWRAKMGAKAVGHGRSAQQRRRDAEESQSKLGSKGLEAPQDSPEELAAWVG